MDIPVRWTLTQRARFNLTPPWGPAVHVTVQMKMTWCKYRADQTGVQAGLRGSRAFSLPGGTGSETRGPLAQGASEGLDWPGLPRHSWTLWKQWAAILCLRKGPKTLQSHATSWVKVTLHS